MPKRPPYVVLDDDPTGVQTLAGIRVLLSWDAGRIRGALDGRPAVHLITNTRALAPDRVGPLVEEAARAALEAQPCARVVLRGDSTLRGHLLEEVSALAAIVAPGVPPVLLLVPALLSAGRVTVRGVHLFERNGRRVPLHETEYAHDGVFAYSSARLLAWAEERTDGLFGAADGAELHLAELRSGGAEAVAASLALLAGMRRPAVLAPDVETPDDLALVAAGFELAAQAGLPVVVRCAPAFAGVLAGTTAREPAPLPDGAGGVLVVCGSYVAQSTRQLAALAAAQPGALIEADARALAGEGTHEAERVAAAASWLLAESGLAIVATPRERPGGTISLAAGERIAHNLARAVSLIRPRPPVVVAKGGITSAVTLRDGAGAREAEVLGPVAPGVSHWSTRWPGGEPLSYLVVPGNVGEDGLLADVVNGMRTTAGGSAPSARGEKPR